MAQLNNSPNKSNEKCLQGEQSRLFRYMADEDTIRQWILFYFVMALVLSIPATYNMISIARASLPYNTISNLLVDGWKLPIRIQIYLPTSIETSTFKLPSDVTEQQISMHGRTIILETTISKEPVGTNTIQMLSALSSDKDIEDYLQSFQKHDDNIYHLYVVPQENSVPRIHLTSSKISLFYFSQNDDLAGLFDHILPTLFHTECEAILAFLSDKMGSDIKSSSVSTRYSLSFHLLHGNSQDRPLFIWDIDRLLRDYFSPILSLLSPLAEFQTESHILYHAPLPILTEYVSHNGTEMINAIPFASLPHFIDPTWALSSLSPDSMQFIVYIPSLALRPLHLLEENGNVSKDFSFFLPGRGGILILNQPETLCFDTFLSQMRVLLQFYDWSHGQSYVLSTTISKTSLFSQYELDRVIRLRTILLTDRAAKNLQSLGRLLQKMTNVVVKNEISNQVHKALHFIDSSKMNFERGEYLKAIENAKIAYDTSERVFFNPDMVAQLYFPTKHKLAVYTPFFLPVLIPVLVKIKKELKALKATHKGK